MTKLMVVVWAHQSDNCTVLFSLAKGEQLMSPTRLTYFLEATRHNGKLRIFVRHQSNFETVREEECEFEIVMLPNCEIWYSGDGTLEYAWVEDALARPEHLLIKYFGTELSSRMRGVRHIGKELPMEELHLYLGPPPKRSVDPRSVWVSFDAKTGFFRLSTRPPHEIPQVQLDVWLSQNDPRLKIYRAIQGTVTDLGEIVFLQIGDNPMIPPAHWQSRVTSLVGYGLSHLNHQMRIDSVSFDWRHFHLAQPLPKRPSMARWGVAQREEEHIEVVGGKRGLGPYL
ncbi:MAG: hypothetical protein ACHQUB_02700 [Candidatus Saccharimonadia bacterium]